MPLVTIILRSLNAIDLIEPDLNRIQAQSFNDYEILNYDLGSDDGTFELIKKFNCRTTRVKPEDYLPGKTLNSAVKKAKGEIIVFCDADCTPANERWLENLIRPLLNDNTVVAAYGCQVPHANAMPLVRKDYAEAFPPYSGGSGWPQWFSLSNTAIRKECLLDYPFDPQIRTLEGEEWAVRIRHSGQKIAYAVDAVAEHSHNYSLKEVYKKYYMMGKSKARIYGFCPDFIHGFFKCFAAACYSDLNYLLRSFRLWSIPYGLIYRLLQRYAEWRGRRDFFRQRS